MSTYSDTVLADSPLLYLRLDETSGASCANAGSLGGTATANGTYTRNVASVHSYLGVAVLLGGSTGDRIDYPDTAALDITGDVTYEIWAKYPSLFGGMLMGKNRDSGSVRGYSIRVRSDGALMFGPSGDVAPLVTAAGAFPFDNTWHHVVGTRSGNTWTLYFDGAQIASVTSSTAVQATSQPFSVGSYIDEFGGGLAWSGTVDEPAVYNTALSAARVLAHYNAYNAAPIVQPRPVKINTSQGLVDIANVTSFVSGVGAPSIGVGATGAIYLDTATGLLYGPKAGGAWPGSRISAPGLAKVIEIKVMDDATVLTTGDGKVVFCIPAALGGYDLTAAHAFVTTVSSSGLPTVQIRNITKSNQDMLATKISIDVSEFTSYSAATAPVVDTTKDDVSTGDLISVDVDVAGTGAKGLGVILTFALP